LAGVAAADTLHLTTGVVVDGVTEQGPDNTLIVKIGDHTMIYRAEEVADLEKNAKTGELDEEALKAAWAAKDKELKDKTGLNVEQRTQVEALITELASPEEARFLAGRDGLVALQKEMDVFRYLSYLMPQSSPVLSGRMLETLVRIDAARARDIVRESAKHVYFGTRAKAIELIGLSGDREGAGLVCRGLVDHSMDVRVAAEYALANLGIKEASLALIECLKSPDMRVGNAGRAALEALWKADLVEPKPHTVDEWTAFYEAHGKGLPTPIKLDAQEPLIPPEIEWQNE
jgi:hypothetical protein